MDETKSDRKSRERLRNVFITFRDEKWRKNDKKEKRWGEGDEIQRSTTRLQRSKVVAGLEDGWNNGGTMSAGQARELSEVGN